MRYLTKCFTGSPVLLPGQKTVINGRKGSWPTCCLLCSPHRRLPRLYFRSCKNVRKDSSVRRGNWLFLLKVTAKKRYCCFNYEGCERSSVIHQDFNVATERFQRPSISLKTLPLIRYSTFTSKHTDWISRGSLFLGTRAGTSRCSPAAPIISDNI